MLARYDLAQFFDGCVCGDMVTRSKPDSGDLRKSMPVDRRSISICGRAGRCAVRRALGSGGRDACDRRARSGGAVGRDSGACMEAVRQSDGCDRDDIRKRRMQTVLQSEMHSPFSRTGVYGIRTRAPQQCECCALPTALIPQRHIKIIALKRQEGKYRI